MTIGQIKFRGQRGQYQSGQGAGEALSRLGAGITNLAATMAEDQDRRARFDANASWAELRGRLDRERLDMVRGAEVNAGGLTQTVQTHHEEALNGFLESLPEGLRESYREPVETYRQSALTTTYGQELELRDLYERDAIVDWIDRSRTEIIAGRTTMEDLEEQAAVFLDSTQLGDFEKQELAEEMLQQLAIAQAEWQFRRVEDPTLPVRPVDGSTAVAPGLSPGEVAFLDLIAARESGGDYALRYDGGRGSEFNPAEGHPRVFVPTEDGDVSSAAGRYMITATTYDDFGNGRGFSPVEQDQIALDIAASRAGMSRDELREVLESGDDEALLALKEALAETWVVLPGIEGEQFLDEMAVGREGEGNGPVDIPDLWRDPRFQDITTDQKLALYARVNAARDAQAQAAEDAYKAGLDQIMAKIELGELGPGQIDVLIDEGLIRAGDVPAVVRAQQEERDKRAAARDYGARVFNGTPTPINADTQEAANTYLEATGVMSGLAEGSPEAQAELLRSFNQTGVTSTEAVNLLAQMARGNNLNEALYALNTLRTMQLQRPGAFLSNVKDEELQSQLSQFGFLQQYGDVSQPTQAVAQWQELNSPEGREMRAKLLAEANALLESDYDLNTITRTVSNQWLDAALPDSPAAREKLASEFNALFRIGYTLYGDAGRAETYAAQQMRLSWGEATIGTGGSPSILEGGLGGQIFTRDKRPLGYLSPLSPRAGYLGNGFSENPSEARDEIRTAILMDRGWAWDEQFAIITDSVTDADVQAGEPGSFIIQRINDLGQIERVMDAAGNIIRFTPVASEAVRGVHAANRAIDELEAQLVPLMQQAPEAANAEEIEATIQDIWGKLEALSRDSRAYVLEQRLAEFEHRVATDSLPPWIVEEIQRMLLERAIGEE